MKRWLMGLLVLVLLIPTTALAGGGGNVRLSRPVTKVAVGEVPIYLQALQHDVYPVDDAVVTITGLLDGVKVSEATAKLDPAFGGDNVYSAPFQFDRPGKWTLQVQANSRIHFPLYRFDVEVLPAGAVVEPLGKLKIMERGSGTNHASTALVEREAPEPKYAPGPAKPARAAPWISGGVVGAAALAGTAVLLLWRRRQAE